MGGLLTRRVLMVLGTVFVVLGALGIILPLMPTTPFLLLAAACYARSSERLSNWLLGNRVFGRILRDYSEGRGVPLGVKALSIAFLWATIGSTAAFATGNLAVRIVLLVVAAGVTAHILTVPTPRRTEHASGHRK